MASPILINEQQALACILHNPEILKNEDTCWFTNKISIDIYETLKTLYAQGASFTTPTVVSQGLRINPEITHEMINGLKDKVAYDLKDYKIYHQRLVEDFVKENVQTKILKTVSTHLASKNTLDLEVLKTTIKDLEWAIETAGQKNLQIKGFKELLPEYELTLTSRSETNFISSGNNYLDQHLAGGGIPKGQFITVFAGPGMGKSSYVLNLVSGKINKKEPVLYAPLEMGKTLSLDKLISLKTKIPLNRFYETDPSTGTVAEYVLEGFKVEKAKLLKNNYFKLVDSTNTSLISIHSNIKEMKKELNVSSVLVVIDLFTMLSDARGDNKASVYQDLCDGFFEILKEENSSGIAVVQSRRKGDINVSTYEDCRKYIPRIEEIKGSQAFEERSRAIISVFRQKHVGIRMLGEGDVEVQIADDILEANIIKQNLGNLSELKYLYEGNIGKTYKYENT